MTSADPMRLLRLLACDDDAITAIVEQPDTCADPQTLVVAALVSAGGERLLARAGEVASTARDRQVVAIAAAYRRGDRELVDALARDHLVDHPDSVLVAWIADASQNHIPISKEER
jgi:hypothetical protein